MNTEKMQRTIFTPPEPKMTKEQREYNDLLSLTTSQAEQIAQQKALIGKLVKGLEEANGIYVGYIMMLAGWIDDPKERLEYAKKDETILKFDTLIERAKPFL